MDEICRVYRVLELERCFPKIFYTKLLDYIATVISLEDETYKIHFDRFVSQSRMSSIFNDFTVLLCALTIVNALFWLSCYIS
jgi:hypothetical protein